MVICLVTAPLTPTVWAVHVTPPSVIVCPTEAVKKAVGSVVPACPAVVHLKTIVLLASLLPDLTIWLTV